MECSRGLSQSVPSPQSLWEFVERDRIISMVSAGYLWMRPFVIRRQQMEDVFLILTLPLAIPMNKLIRSDWFTYEFSKKIPYSPRIMNWIIATWGGLFWLPCPLCQRNFGGHESGGTLYSSAFSGEGVCRKCADKAREQNIATYAKHSTTFCKGTVGEHQWH